MIGAWARRPKKPAQEPSNLGLTHAGAIAYRVLVGRLIRISRGVYAVGHLGTDAGEDRRAALLAIGDDAVRSHLSSAADWKIRMPAPVVVDITCPRWLPRRDGIRLRRHTLEADLRRILSASSGS